MNEKEWLEWFTHKVQTQTQTRAPKSATRQPVTPTRVQLRSQLDDAELAALVAKRARQHQREEKQRRAQERRVRFNRLCQQLSPFWEAMRLVGLAASKPKHSKPVAETAFGKKLKAALSS